MESPLLFICRIRTYSVPLGNTDITIGEEYVKIIKSTRSIRVKVVKQIENGVKQVNPFSRGPVFRKSRLTIINCNLSKYKFSKCNCLSKIRLSFV